MASSCTLCPPKSNHRVNDSNMHCNDNCSNDHSSREECCPDCGSISEKSSHIAAGSMCSDGENCRCSSSSLDHCHSYSHDHSLSHTESLSWKEELKPTSTASSCSQYKNNKHFNKQHKSTAADYNAVMPTSNTMKSLAATNSTSQQNRNRRRPCYCCCRSRAHSRLCVFFFFFICVLGAIATFFCWPRTPRVSMGGGADSLSGAPDWWAGERQPLPSPDTPIPSRPSLRATWQINVTLDNRDNWIPTHLTKLDFVILDSLTLAKFAWASTSSALELAPGTISPISLTFNVNYQAADRTDPTFQNLYNACGPLSDSKQRPALNVLLRVSFHIFGIVWTPLVTATPYTGGILCPIK
ncbi:hypothetical protein MAM1_0179c07359 [Mucor ambiguus]|uniref:Uncharacterized protein n=1 Tax=Mucor ambiguus TaxID=91626 RepID=A0A0C9LW39_9FUNG|nr:hypothetical protein MAM1_0179c07359 [Mucor ambiguus]